MEPITTISSKIFPTKEKKEQAKGILKVTLCALMALAIFAGFIALTIAFPHIMVPIDIALVSGGLVGYLFMRAFEQPSEKPTCRSCFEFLKRY